MNIQNINNKIYKVILEVNEKLYNISKIKIHNIIGDNFIGGAINVFLIGCFFIAVAMVYFGKKEGFYSSPKDYSQSHKGALLGYPVDDVLLGPEYKTMKHQKKIFDKYKNPGYKQITNNQINLETPCNGESPNPNMCVDLYGNRKLYPKKSNDCRPPLDCKRVGYFCSKL